MENWVRHEFLEIIQSMLFCYRYTFTRKAKKVLEVAFHPWKLAKCVNLNDKNLRQKCVNYENQKNIVTKEQIFIGIPITHYPLCVCIYLSKQAMTEHNWEKISRVGSMQCNNCWCKMENYWQICVSSLSHISFVCPFMEWVVNAWQISVI